jgi:hypothetical protein
MQLTGGPAPSSDDTVGQIQFIVLVKSYWLDSIIQIEGFEVQGGHVIGVTALTNTVLRVLENQGRSLLFDAMCTE